VVRRAEDALKRVLQIRVPVELLAPGSIPETTFKARRVVDERTEI
jgi:phenylacetate-CoA ligase